MTILDPEQLKKISNKRLKSLADYGIVKVMLTIPYQDINFLSDLNKEDLPEYKKYSNLSGHPIHISAAARKYKVPQQNISRWVQSGYITILGMEKNRKLVDEADVAYCADIWRMRSKRGRWLFDKGGKPYTPK